MRCCVKPTMSGSSPLAVRRGRRPLRIALAAALAGLLAASAARAAPPSGKVARAVRAALVESPGLPPGAVVDVVSLRAAHPRALRGLRAVRSVRLPPGERPGGTVLASVEFVDRTGRVRTDWVTVRTRVRTPVLVARHALARGSTVTPADVEVVLRTRVPAGALHAPDEVRGKVAARNLSAGDVVRKADVRAPVVFERGAAVTLIVRGRGVRVRTAAVALEPATAGKRVRVRVESTGRVVQAVAVDGAHAKLELP